jgi:hypothetical protein
VKGLLLNSGAKSLFFAFCPKCTSNSFFAFSIDKSFQKLNGLGERGVKAKIFERLNLYAKMPR